MTTPDPVPAIRAFNRFYTNLIGVLHGELLDTPYTLTEARVLYDLAQSGPTDVAELRRGLDIDPGYLSRILSRFTTAGLVARQRSATDGRRQVITLAEAGRAAWLDLDARSARQITELLAAVGEADRRRLVGAMATIEEILSDSRPPTSFVLRPLSPGDLGWVVQRHGALYAQEYGWDREFEGLVARIVADYVADHDPSRENFWIAEVDGRPVGSICCAYRDDRTAQLRLLLVEPDGRGTGIGGRLVEECLRFARRAGYRDIVLFTYDRLSEARRIYQRAGFELDREEKAFAYGQDLVSQYWRRVL